MGEKGAKIETLGKKDAKIKYKMDFAKKKYADEEKTKIWEKENMWKKKCDNKKSYIQKHLSKENGVLP